MTSCHGLGKQKIIVIKGVRQVGKTTILKEMEMEINKFPKAKTVYLLADDFDNAPLFKSESSLELYLRQFHDFPNQFLYLIIDEFQVIKQAGLFLKNVFDKHKDRLQLIVSGSGSLEITHNTEFLTGRVLFFTLERVSFMEYCDYIFGTKFSLLPPQDFKQITIFYNTFKNKLDKALKEYLFFDGCPEVITTTGLDYKRILLASIVKTL